MKNKLLAGFCAILVLAALAGCDSDSGSTTPTLDWGKITNYNPEVGDMVLGTAAAALVGTNGRFQETVLGNFAMDGIAEYAKHISGVNIDFAMHNGQNLRVPEGGSLPAGELNNSAILALMGTDNLFICTYTGEQIKTILNIFVNSDHTAGGTGWNRNCAVMVSKGISYDISPDTDPALPPKATNIKVNGVAINDAKEYKVALGSFIGGNDDVTRFPVLDESKRTSYAPTTLAQSLAMYVLAKGTINPADYPLGRYTGIVPEIP